ncbi:MAG: glycosyltransferase [Methanomassiliicoccales archaeon]|nr:glycosyltransferase [Methanomassiliicoccales archaeon]
MFTDTYLPTRDGVVTSILITKAELERLGHQVTVFAPENGRTETREEDVIYVRSLGFKRYPGYRVPIFPTNKCELLEELGVEVIHSQGLLFMALRSMFAGRSLKLPVVTTFHTMVTDAAKYYNFTPFPDWMVDHLMWTYLRRLLQRSEAVIAPSAAIEKELWKYAPRMRRVDVIPTGVDSVRFRPDNDGSAVRARYGLEGKEVILVLGRIAWEKNMDLLLHGFALLNKEDPNTVMLIVGEGPAREHYMQMAKELGISERTVFTGFVPDQDLPQYYAACDAFTIASKFETQGLVVLEAMASGKPVAGIDFRAVAEIVHDGEDGYLFKESPEDWKAAVRRALDSDRCLRSNARKRAEQFSIAEGTRRLIEVYEYSIHSKRKRVGLE